MSPNTNSGPRERITSRRRIKTARIRVRKRESALRFRILSKEHANG